MTEIEHRYTNRLAGETSPYLLQHAHNPVDWYPWGPEALAAARDLDRPIFLSIGYAACHWCHVMERESFEDEATAAALRADFIAIKVDREERPDLDQVYMSAVQALTGSGGWPMSMFLTPDGRPFYGGTYFPPEPRHGMPAFRQVLAGVAEAWRDRRSEVISSGQRLVDALTTHGTAAGGGAMTAADGAAGPGGTIATLDEAVAALEASFDARRGGWGGAPKFPPSMAIEFLLRRSGGPDGRVDGDGRALAMARRTLDAMAAGGIHDQLGGGFHRYSTDADWLVPHFEQMLYDNAQLARVYLHAWQLTGEPSYRDVAIGTLDFMVRDLMRSDGTFAASLDADTNGVEGATFTWSRSEIRDALEAAADSALVGLVDAAYGVTEAGNWEGRTILSRVRSDAELEAIVIAHAPARAQDREVGTGVGTGVAEKSIAVRLAKARSTLLARRAERPQPTRDDKALAGWNGLAIGALADAAAAFSAAAVSEPSLATRGREYREVAVQAAEALLDGLGASGGRLRRSWKDGRAAADAVLEDYAHLGEGLLALYEATFDERWFATARSLAEVILARFADPDGGFFDTADDAEALVTRPKELSDNAIPSGGSMTATLLLKLHALTGEDRYRVAAETALRGVVGTAPHHPAFFGQWLTALDLALGSVVEVAIAGRADDPGRSALIDVARQGFRPRQVIAVASDGVVSEIALLESRTAIGGRPTAYVCRDFACRLPVTEPAALAAQLALQRAADADGGESLDDVVGTADDTEQ